MLGDCRMLRPPESTPSFRAADLKPGRRAAVTETAASATDQGGRGDVELTVLTVLVTRL